MDSPNITYRDFGNENIDFVTLEKMAILDGKDKIPETLKYIHFNPEYPENYNIRLTEELMKENTIEIRENGKWVKKDIDTMMPIIQQSIIEKIKRKYILEDKIDQQIKRGLKAFLQPAKRKT